MVHLFVECFLIGSDAGENLKFNLFSFLRTVVQRFFVVNRDITLEIVFDVIQRFFDESFGLDIELLKISIGLG